MSIDDPTLCPCCKPSGVTKCAIWPNGTPIGYSTKTFERIIRGANNLKLLHSMPTTPEEDDEFTIWFRYGKCSRIVEDFMKNEDDIRRLLFDKNLRSSINEAVKNEMSKYFREILLKKESKLLNAVERMKKLDSL